MRIIFILVFCLLSSCKENLIRLGTEVEANRVLLNLSESGIQASKVSEATDWIIKVNASQFTEALSVLERKRLYARIGSVPEVKGDMFSSRRQKENELLERVSYSLSQSIVMLPGVIDARVHIFKGEDGSLVKPVVTESASVVVISDASHHIDSSQIKTIVAKGAGISSDSVAVIESVVKENIQLEVLSPESEKSTESKVDRGNQLDAFRKYLKFEEWSFENRHIKWLLAFIAVFIVMVVFMKIISIRRMRKERDEISKIMESE